MLKLISLLLLTHTLSSQINNRSNRNSQTDKLISPNIVGGDEVKPKNRYPFIVSIRWKGNHVCGGTLIRPDIVLTAAHCSTGSTVDFKVEIGRHDINQPISKEPGAQSIQVLNRYVHEAYDQDQNYNDIAIWKLTEKYKGKFEPIALDGEDSIDINGSGAADVNSLGLAVEGTSLIALGWGRTRPDGPLATTLMQVQLPTLKFLTCSSNMKDQGYEIKNTLQICAGFSEGGKDTCQGDSGGPLIYSNANSNNSSSSGSYTVKQAKNKVVLVGITSFGISCAMPNLPGVYTRIKAQLSWIQKALKVVETAQSTNNIVPTVISSNTNSTAADKPNNSNVNSSTDNLPIQDPGFEINKPTTTSQTPTPININNNYNLVKNGNVDRTIRSNNLDLNRLDRKKSINRGFKSVGKEEKEDKQFDDVYRGHIYMQ